MNRNSAFIPMSLFISLLGSMAAASDIAPVLKCENRHDQSSQFELSQDQHSGILKVLSSDPVQSFQFDCYQLESENFSIGCQDSGMPSIYQVFIDKTQDRAFLYEYGLESAVIMSDLHCIKP